LVKEKKVERRGEQTGRKNERAKKVKTRKKESESAQKGKGN